MFNCKKTDEINIQKTHSVDRLKCIMTREFLLKGCTFSQILNTGLLLVLFQIIIFRIYCYTKHQLKNVVFYRVAHNKPEPPAYICGINNAKYVRKPTVFWKLREHQYLIKPTVFFPSNSRCGDINHQSQRVLQAGWPSRYPGKANQEPRQHEEEKKKTRKKRRLYSLWVLTFKTNAFTASATDRHLATFSFRSCRQFSSQSFAYIGGYGAVRTRGRMMRRGPDGRT